jgi:hypothetical protein
MRMLPQSIHSIHKIIQDSLEKASTANLICYPAYKIRLRFLGGKLSVTTTMTIQNTPGSCMVDYRGKKRACWPNPGLAWLDSMAISIESTSRRRISVHVAKQEKPWSTSSFDVGSGPHTGRKCYDVPIPTEATYPSSWAENRPPMARTGRRTWKQCGPQYGSQSPRADSTPLSHVDDHESLTPPDLTYTNHLVPETVDALQLLRIGC